MRDRIGSSLDTNYWTHGDVFCRECDGEGQMAYPGNVMQEPPVFYPCPSCAETGYEPIPWTELFKDLRPGEPMKQPL